MKEDFDLGLTVFLLQVLDSNWEPHTVSLAFGLDSDKKRKHFITFISDQLFNYTKQFERKTFLKIITQKSSPRQAFYSQFPLLVCIMLIKAHSSLCFCQKLQIYVMVSCLPLKLNNSFMHLFMLCLLSFCSSFLNKCSQYLVM